LVKFFNSSEEQAIKGVHYFSGGYKLPPTAN
jgi:hypothetical protein